jgi:HD-GYP domain-containing protein (c-di-GMP phosphodiesterase class II)
MKIEVEKNLLKSLLIMGAVIEARDVYTGGHLWRVSQYAKLLGEKVGLERDDVVQLTLSGFLHDLGKVGVPDAILNKKDSLTDREYDVIKTHPVIGADLIQEHPLSVIVHDAIRHHHERIDGMGYPDRLAGEKITLRSKIISIADAFDAMTSTRPYRTAMEIDSAIDDLRAQEGKQFDDDLIDKFCELKESEVLQTIVLHSDEQVSLLRCPTCGPVIAIPVDSKDGDIVHCRVCTNDMKLHRSGDTFETAHTGRKGTPDQLKPAADAVPITRLIEQTPKSLVIDA